MPANNDYPVLDGITPSWADIIVSVKPDGAPLISMKDIKAINTASKVEVGYQKAGGRVMKRTTGDKTDEASWTLYRDGWHRLVRGLLDLAPKRGGQYLVSLVHFVVQVQHTPPGSTDIFEYRIKGCRVLSRQLNGTESIDPDAVENTLNCVEIADIIDGKEVVLL